MINTGKPYEELTQAVFNWINNSKREGVEFIKVQRDLILEGKDTRHQIDVYWEFMVGVTTYKVIVQTKDLKRKVNKPQMLTFLSVLNDLPGTQGIFVTTVGFQSGALEVAKRNNIETFVLKQAEDNDWDGLIKTVQVKMQLLIPFAEDLNLNIDGAWAEKNKITEKQSNRIGFDPQQTLIIDEFENKTTLFKLINDFCNEIGIGSEMRSVEYDDNTFMLCSDGQKYKIKEFSGRFGLRELMHEFTIDGGNLVDIVLKNAATQQVEGFFSENKVLQACQTEASGGTVVL